MSGDLKDYLQAMAADYQQLLDISPQQVVVESAFLRQNVVEYDDTSVAVMTRSTGPKAFFFIRWDGLSAVDAGKVLDFYLDPAKGKGKARSFEFENPHDGHIYIVQFDSEISREHRYNTAIPEIKLRVRGYKDEESSSSGSSV